MSIVCHVIHSKWTEPTPGESFTLHAYHDDGTVHDLGEFASIEDADRAAGEWKRSHQDINQGA